MQLSMRTVTNATFNRARQPASSRGSTCAVDRMASLSCTETLVKGSALSRSASSPRSRQPFLRYQPSLVGRDDFAVGGLYVRDQAEGRQVRYYPAFVNRVQGREVVDLADYAERQASASHCRVEFVAHHVPGVPEEPVRR